MSRIAWRWEDMTEGTVLYMPINPNEGASPTFQKTLTKQTTTAPGTGATTVIFEGADEFVYNLWSKRHLVRLTDDLGRGFVLYFESFSPKRERSAQYPWRHTYEASAVVIANA
jgi:hypothetical protein